MSFSDIAGRPWLPDAFVLRCGSISPAHGGRARLAFVFPDIPARLFRSGPIGCHSVLQFDRAFQSARVRVLSMSCSSYYRYTTTDWRPPRTDQADALRATLPFSRAATYLTN